jgi:membrane carboxypeptidase/penicillin-binding protein
MAFMERAKRHYNPREFDVPEGIVYAEIDADTGEAPTITTKRYIKEPFKKDNTPVDEESWIYKISPANIKRALTN